MGDMETSGYVVWEIECSKRDLSYRKVVLKAQTAYREFAFSASIFSPL